DLEGVVRFGFGAFTGTVGTTCPIFDQVPAALSNYAAISIKYRSLGPLATKAETPVSAALAVTSSALTADTSPGRQYILFVTDGEPDFCDDGNPVCPTDSVIAHLQSLQAAGITTLVF